MSSIGVSRLNDLTSFNPNTEKRLDDELLFSNPRQPERDMSKINKTAPRKSLLSHDKSPFGAVESLRQAANLS